MSWQKMEMVINHPVSDIDDFSSFRDLLKVSCDDLKLTEDDNFCMLLEESQQEMKNLFEELSKSVDPKKRNQIKNQILSCKNQLCTQLHKRYIEIQNQSNT